MKTIALAGMAVLLSLGVAEAGSVGKPLHSKYCVVSRTHKPPVTCPMHPESVVGSPCHCLVTDDGRQHEGIVQQTTASTKRVGQ